MKLNESVDLLLSLGQVLRAVHAATGGDRNWLALGLTMAQFKALVLVASSGGLTGGAIAERMGVGPSAVTPLVDRLVRLQLARRQRDPDDRRVIWVRPTKKALDLWGELLQTNRATLTDVLGAVPPQELESVHRSLTTLVEASRRVLARHERPGR